MNILLNITGMSCEHCAAGVKAALEGVDGVSFAVVSLKNNTAEVDFDENKTNPFELMEAVGDAGFDANISK